ncbi:MAG TPA: hypothetical protein VFX28_11780 [Methylomirabilota bacterium]|nr:hypothetical protein [Methylomirabilota bacterium]
MKVIFWGLVVIVAAYLFYGAVMSAWSYIEIAGTVDEVLGRVAVSGQRDPQSVRAAIMQGAQTAGVPVGERDVAVSDDGRTFAVNVAWRIPVLVVSGETVVAFPLSLSRTLNQPVVR